MAYKNNDDKKRWTHENREKIKELQHKWYLNHRNTVKSKSSLNYQIWRYEALSKLGNRCSRCGFSDERALQIDHISGGGTKERGGKGYGPAFYKEVVSSLIINEGKFQLLCANCNWIKRVENKENRRMKGGEI